MTEQTTISPADSHYVDALRSKVANLNDENIRLEAQVNFQAQVIADLQAQLEEHAHE